ncbi:hypothetical protein TD95_003225 [Thielaviopsis punctulata]|uniref:CBM1 domain-containing protein n=1 Tax=Thielaviopsis punctulata TaxID=72032 RepID=A0A0F4ZDA9_9PEZI|nr:hypothetical protein TD95_003225 [Thielaviopsis punctulata]
MPSFTSTVAAALFSAAAVSAHGHVTNIVHDKAFFQGWDINKGMGYNNYYPDTVGWPNTVTDNGFVDQSGYASPDIVCHRGANASEGYATVAAGDIVQLDWTPWPESHKGPVIDYMAACPDAGCGSVPKTSLEFFKVSQVGLVDESLQNGKWGADLLRLNNNTWEVQVPKALAPGFYVLRNEIIALHSTGAPQNYPQCVTLKVTGTGTDKPSGVVGEKLYTSGAAINSFNIYASSTSYSIPGPTLIAGATPILKQSSEAALSTITPTTVSSGAVATGSSGSGSAAAPAAATTSAAAAGSSAAASSGPSSTAATAAATSQAAASTTSASSAAATTSASPSKGSCNKRKRAHARGGGFVPSVVFHPNVSGVAYLRTDIGGVYRMNSDQTWTPITDSITFNSSWHNWGCDALAVDPQDENKVYAAVGGNMPGRGMGERLAVDPANSNIIYFGARSGKGLWRSTDGGKTFSNVTSFTDTGPFAPNPQDSSGYNSDPQGLTFVTFDTTSGTVDGATARIFVGTADNSTSGASVWQTKDAGKTWSAVEGQPGKYFPHKCRLSPSEQALYLSYSDGTGPYDGTMGGVYRYDLRKNSWTNITPVSGSDLYFGFGGLSVDIKKPGTVMVAALNSWFPDAQIFRSTDSGATWTQLWEWTSYPSRDLYYGSDYSAAPWIEEFLQGDTKKLGWMIESLEIDPHDSDHWVYGTGLTLFGGNDLTKWDTVHNISIDIMATGIEEMAVLGLASVPGGTELLAAVGDDSGFSFASSADLGTPPKTMWGTPKFTSSTGVDYAGASPKTVVRIGNSAGSPQVAMSNDGGATWYANQAAGTTAEGGSVALSADATSIVWSSANSGVMHSSNSASFSAVSSLPSGAVVASDKKNAKYFYAGSGSSFYVSSDGGATFSASSSALSGVSSVRAIAAHPSTAGQIYVSTNAGVFVSTDFGKTFSALGKGTISNAYAIALGKGSAGTNIYVLADGPAGAKLYASADNGKTWSDIQGNSQGFGSLAGCVLAGSNNEANQVYVGTNGRGVIYASGTVSGGTAATSDFVSTVAAETATDTSQAASATHTTFSTAVVSSTSSSAPATSSASSSSGGSASGTVGQYGQCGGTNWTGPTSCVSGFTCKAMNPYYSQCV